MELVQAVELSRENRCPEYLMKVLRLVPPKSPTPSVRSLPSDRAEASNPSSREGYGPMDFIHMEATAKLALRSAERAEKS